MYGEFIKKHRLLSGYKRQNQLSKVSGISAATLSRIEKEIQLPEVRTLRALSLCLHTTSFEELMSVCGYGELELSHEETPPLDIDICNGNTIKYTLSIDGQKLTDTEVKGVLSYVRSFRSIK
jgi:transcriptional regulator with XRE-family HTH domain